MIAANVFLFSLATAFVVVAAKKPNILLLLSDDQDVLLGSLDYMPLYQKYLAKQGTTFKNYFVHTPICCSSRSSILSGRYIHNGGAIGNGPAGNCYGPEWRANNEHYTFAVYAQQAGYRTSYAGKYLNYYGFTPETPVVPPGWDKWYGTANGGFAQYYYNYKVVQSEDGGNVTVIPHGNNYTTDYLQDLVANRTLEKIREFSLAPDGKPWLIVNAWTAPHGNFEVAPWAVNLYLNATAPRTPNWNASSEYQQQKHWLLRQEAPIDSTIAYQIDNTQKLRAQCLASLDSHIEQFVTLLDQLGQLENTIIIYTSDNGFQLGQHRLITEKLHMYESDIRVPFVIRGPGIPKNKAVSDLAANVDITPTIFRLVNGDSVPLPDRFDGIPLVPIVLDTRDTKRRKRPKRTDILINYHGNGSPPCGLLNQPPFEGPNCPPPPPQLFHDIDALNNTFNCLRTIVYGKQVDFTYCRFQDNENFAEWYDNVADPWQLHNKAYKLSNADLADLDARLNRLINCQGPSCQLPPYQARR